MQPTLGQSVLSFLLDGVSEQLLPVADRDLDALTWSQLKGKSVGEQATCLLLLTEPDAAGDDHAACANGSTNFD